MDGYETDECAKMDYGVIIKFLAWLMVSIYRYKPCEKRRSPNSMQKAFKSHGISQHNKRNRFSDATSPTSVTTMAPTMFQAFSLWVSKPLCHSYSDLQSCVAFLQLGTPHP